MSDDMSEMIKKMSEMLKNNEIPDNIKSIMNNLASTSTNNNTNLSSNYNSNCSFPNGSSTNCNTSNSKDGISHESTEYSNVNSNNSSSFDMSNIDLNSMLKMKSIIDTMNREQNDPRANLLRSLKPYLKNSRKEKVDQYIKLFSMGKVFETLNPLGGEKKNDV